MATTRVKHDSGRLRSGTEDKKKKTAEKNYRIKSVIIFVIFSRMEEKKIRDTYMLLHAPSDQ